MRAKAFSGRVIFDRMPKTGGHAVARWLRQELGSGVVTDNLISGHRELIRRFGGLYSVLSAHVHYEGKGLDPRYQYVTALRDPVDRAVSWLYFILGNHRPQHLEPGLWDAVKRFVDSDGAEISPAMAGNISNYYVGHFSRILGISETSDRERLADAKTALAHFQVCGFYEELGDFVGDLAKLMQVPAPRRLEQDNVTRDRPHVDEISPRLRRRLEALNELDLDLYRLQRHRYNQGQGRPGGLSAPLQPVWLPVQEPFRRMVETSSMTLLSASADSLGEAVEHGARIRFTLDFTLHRPVDDLVVGIHIVDQDQRHAFGTNTQILGRPLRQMRPGRYHANFDLAADLPEGGYNAGFAFVDQTNGRMEEIAWFDRRVDFAVRVEKMPGSGGYVGLETGFSCTPAAARAAIARSPILANARKLRVMPHFYPKDVVSS